MTLLLTQLPPVMAITSQNASPRIGIPSEQDSAKQPLAKPRPGRDDGADDEDDFDTQAWEPFDDDFAEPPEAASRGDGVWANDPNNPAEMARWAGQPSVRGGSDAIRMVLLNFCTLGITYVRRVQTYAHV